METLAAHPPVKPLPRTRPPTLRLLPRTHERSSRAGLSVFSTIHTSRPRVSSRSSSAHQASAACGRRSQAGAAGS